MKISVVIPTQGEIQRIHRLLQSLEQQTEHENFETLLVCNPPNKQLEAFRNQFPNLNLRVLQSKNIGANHARQLGFNQSRHDLVCFFDDDCVLKNNNTLADLVSVHQRQSDLFAVGGRYSFESEKPTQSQRLYFQMQNRWIQEGLLNLETLDCAYLFGGFFSIKKHLAIKYQIQFDVGMKFGGTEKEFCLQARRKNLTLRLLPLTVQHTYSESFLNYLMKVYKQGRGQRYIEKKDLFFEPRYRLTDSEAVSLQSYLLQSSYWLGYYAFDYKILAFLKNRFVHAKQAIALNKVLLLNRIKKDL